MKLVAKPKRNNRSVYLTEQELQAYRVLRKSRIDVSKLIGEFLLKLVKELENKGS